VTVPQTVTQVQPVQLHKRWFFSNTWNEPP